MKKSILFVLFFNINIFCASHKTIDPKDVFVLITTLYNEANQERCNEYISCLERNLQHPLIKKIHVLYDTSKDQGKSVLLDFIIKKEIPVSYISRRPTYQNCFDVANTMYPNAKIIVSNGDIYFNNTLFALQHYNLTDKFLALTRWETNKDNTLRPQIGTNGRPLFNSQDCWIFVSPIRTFNNTNVQLGILGCDGTIAKQAVLSGMNVINPCLTIQCCHLHFVNIRHYPHESYPPSGYYDVKWCHLK